MKCVLSTGVEYSGPFDYRLTSEVEIEVEGGSVNVQDFRVKL